MTTKLIKKIEISGVLTLKTGLHIGGTNSSMSIGGIDKGVIRNPLTNQPYIPGSSLKGKLRALFQISIGQFKELPRPMGGVVNVSTDNGLDADLFGNATGKPETQKPSRVIVRDSNLRNPDILLKNTEIPYTEGKTEVVIDRITSAANPRQIERVPAGAEFEINMVLNIWEGEDEKILKEHLKTAIRLLHDDYLGGQGSRGYGQVELNIEKVIEKNMDFYRGKDEKGNDITPEFKL